MVSRDDGWVRPIRLRGFSAFVRSNAGKKAAWRELCGIIGHLGSEISRNGNKHALPLFEIARVLVRFDYGVTAFDLRRRTESRARRFPLNRKSQPHLSESGNRSRRALYGENCPLRRRIGSGDKGFYKA
jgi:hypothetical protein